MNEFALFIEETLKPFGEVDIRRMFGGYGVFHEGLMIAIIADESLYLKTDQRSLPAFEALGLDPFEFEKKGKTVRMSFSEAPEQIYDDADIMQEWLNRAFEAALRSRGKR